MRDVKINKKKNKKKNVFSETMGDLLVKKLLVTAPK